MMKAAKQMVFIIDQTKFVEKLEGAIPVLIQQVLPDLLTWEPDTSRLPVVAVVHECPQDNSWLSSAVGKVVLITMRSNNLRSLKSSIILTVQENWIDVAEEIDDLFLGDAEVHPTLHVEVGEWSWANVLKLFLWCISERVDIDMSVSSL